MTFAVFCAVLVTLVTFILTSDAAVRGSACFTPNNERASCVPVSFCKVIKEAIATRNSSAINFAKQSQCGYDYEPLVCCGSTGYPVSTLVFDIFTNPFQSSSTVTPFEHKLLPDISVCGIEIENDRVFGGQNTNLDEFPWLALLRYKDEVGGDAGFRCGGSLINHRYVLTAAHCAVVNPNTGLNLDIVRLGEWKISTSRDCLKNGECSNPVVDIGIEEVVSHPYYGRRSRENDIALLRLKRDVEYTDFIRPICIPSPDSPLPVVGSQLTVAGWGATENSSSSDVKLKVQVPLVSQSDCATKFVKRAQITDYQVCAGGAAGKDSCQGDSGGPLMRLVENSSPGGVQSFLEGIISWGVGCGIEGFPGVHTRVSKYAKWITNNMREF